MAVIETIFKNRKVKPDQLLCFGFSYHKNGYSYSTSLLDGQFELTVTVTKQGKISTAVIDNASKEPYILHCIANAQGPFVGKVRQEYEAVLTSIANHCFEADVFKSKDARQVIEYIRQTYQDEPQFLWKRFSNNAVFRRQDNSKWYAALLIVPKQKLGLKGEGTIEIIDLKMKPEQKDVLIDGKSYLPGYHMNKNHWYSICLDGSVPLTEIFSRIDDSYILATK